MLVPDALRRRWKDRKLARKWEEQFLKFMKEQMPEVRELIAAKKEITPEVEQKLTAAIGAFNQQFKA